MLLLSLVACSPRPAAEPPPTERPGSSLTRGTQLPSQNDEEPTVGRWNRARPSISEEIAQLEAIGYVGGTESPPARVGVTLHSPAAVDGLNFYVSGHAPEAVLMDMDGTVLHTWRKSFREVWPDRQVRANAQGPNFWRRAALLPGGELLAIYEGQGLIKLDRNSKLVWSWDRRAHHDLEVLEDGRIWVLARKATIVPELHPKRPVLVDHAVLLNPDGVELERIDILQAVLDSAPDLLKHLPRRHGDVFHTNSIERIGDQVDDPRFAPGSLLLSMRAPSAILVLDPRTRRITWWHRGTYRKQHDPTILPDGNLLLFDNLGPGDGISAVREFRLPEMEEVWTYQGNPDQPFFSRFCGASQRLPNGHTLISESGIGRAFEIRPDGTRVWVFDNPARAGDDGAFVAIVPELLRLPRSVTDGWLNIPQAPTTAVDRVRIGSTEGPR